MPKLEIDDQHLTITLSIGEAMGSFKSGFTLDLDHVRGAQVLDQKFWHTLGIRVPGVGLPGLMVAGTYLKKADKAFVCWKRKQQVLQINLADEFYDRLVLGVDDAEAWAEKINSALAGC